MQIINFYPKNKRASKASSPLFSYHSSLHHWVETQKSGKAIKEARDQRHFLQAFVW